MALPPPDAEDAWIADWVRTDDPEALLDAVALAVDARRVMLAARLVQLLPEAEEGEPEAEAITRARRAAGLLLFRRTGPEDDSWSVFEDAWHDLRQDRMARALLRQRRRVNGDDRPVRRLDARGTRRRR